MAWHRVGDRMLSDEEYERYEKRLWRLFLAGVIIAAAAALGSLAAVKSLSGVAEHDSLREIGAIVGGVLAAVACLVTIRDFRNFVATVLGIGLMLALAGGALLAVGFLFQLGE